MYSRPILTTLTTRLAEPRRFLQVLAGPRQVGKTTLARQALATLERPTHFASADGPVPRDTTWLRQQWELGRLAAREHPQGAVLVIDEVQKIASWAEAVKAEWDHDSGTGTPLQVVLLGSAPLLVRRGLSESLAGRFELIPVAHWSWPEMHQAFGWDLDQYVFFGGYPGPAPLVGDWARWQAYVRESLIETTIGRDVLLLQPVRKPALLRRLFELACVYSGQELSYNKMLGQLQDAGNTTTLAHYLSLLSDAGMVAGLDKYAGQAVRRRGSSPKLQVWNTALLAALGATDLAATRRDAEQWGRAVESAVGAHLLNTARGTGIEVLYWRDGRREVDFVLRHGDRLAAIEVKSVRSRRQPGMAAFEHAFSPAHCWLVGPDGIELGGFLSRPAADWLA